MTFAENVIDFHFALNPDWHIPSGIQIIFPFKSDDVQQAFSSFYKKFFDDHSKRHFILGINPGRFGAGITGIPFTDPLMLEETCHINSPFKKKNELSALFVYDFITALGGPYKFYSRFYITSVCPLGFIKDGKNYNYYDDKELLNSVESHIINNIESQKSFGCYEDVAFCMGKGKNFKCLVDLNRKYKFFTKIVPLPHPRWVMQYRLKTKEEHINYYISELSKVM